jgi:hypothetical protein
MPIEETVSELTQWASEGALGSFEADAMERDILGGILKLRMRIDELGGYHDDI